MGDITVGKIASLTKDRYATRPIDIAVQNLEAIVGEAERHGAVATWRDDRRSVRVERRVDKRLVEFTELTLQVSDDGKDARRITVTMGFSGSTVTRGALVVDQKALDDAVTQLGDAWNSLQRPDQPRRLAVAGLLLARPLLTDGIASVSRFAAPPASLRERLDLINEEAQEDRLAAAAQPDRALA
jgi:hypothetical protein